MVVDEMTTVQKYIVGSAAAIAVLMILFPPINLEKRFATYTIEGSLYETTFVKFIGWKFVGQNDIQLRGKPKWEPKDPKNLTLWERLNAPGPSTVEELKVGEKRISFRYLGYQMFVLIMLAGVAVFFTRAKEKAPKA